MAKGESEVERDHGHCADVLMSDYGIPRHMRKRVCEEVAKVWKHDIMFHDIIAASVRGWQPNPATATLESFLRQHATHEPKNHKGSKVIEDGNGAEEWA
jgi:hypothetical protein